jgi:hypothetical protein
MLLAPEKGADAQSGKPLRPEVCQGPRRRAVGKDFARLLSPGSHAPTWTAWQLAVLGAKRGPAT